MPVEVQMHDAVAEVTLDWPEVRNALGPAQGRELREALERATEDTKVATVIISARGKAFCAGGNLPEIVELAAAGPQTVQDTIYREFQGVFRAIRQSPVPIIAAVDGPAVGFGCDLALAGHLTLIGEKGWLAQGWSKAGLIPATGGAHYVARRGGAQALWKLMARDKVDGQTAEAWGLGLACLDARESALETGARWAKLPQKALRALVGLSAVAEPDAHLARALELQVGLLTDPEFATFARALLAR